MSANSSPRSGDWVRGVEDNRGAETVEGILHIRHIPVLGSAHVNVIVDGRSRHVRPESVEVLRAAEISVEDLEASDPIVDDVGWRRVLDLDQARAEGLLSPPVERLGGTWDDLFAALHERVTPLLAAGWVITGKEREESREFGDSVFYDLERGATVLNVEYYEHGQFVVYPVNEMPDDDPEGEPTKPFFSLYESSPASCRSAFDDQGWLRPDDQQAT